LNLQVTAAADWKSVNPPYEKRWRELWEPFESASNGSGGLEKRQLPNASGCITETVGRDGVLPSRRLNLQVTAAADWKSVNRPMEVVA